MADITEHQFPKPNINTIGKSVLVTGGAGYVGSHTCKALKKNGFIPIIIDRNIERPNHTTFGPQFQVDLPRDQNYLDEIIKRYNVQSCIHFAGNASVSESVKNPSKYYKNNVVATIALLDQLVRNNIKTFVFSSSAAVYGDPGNQKCKESMIPDPINPYGVTKLITERILKDYKTAYGISSVSLRYFNAAGADPDLEIGEDRGTKETHIIPLAIEASIKMKPFKLFGTNYNTPDGTCVRDYIHVMDLADAHIKALNYANQQLVCEQINLGNNIPITNREILNCVQKHTGKMTIIEEPNRPGDPEYLVADNIKAGKILNWYSTQSSIDNIVSTAVKWYNKLNKKNIQ